MKLPKHPSHPPHPSHQPDPSDQPDHPAPSDLSDLSNQPAPSDLSDHSAPPIPHSAPPSEIPNPKSQIPPAASSEISNLKSEIPNPKSSLPAASANPQSAIHNPQSTLPVIAVLSGGTSSERAVSLLSGAACADALCAAFPGAAIESHIIDRDALPASLDPRRHVVFSTLHGTFGEDGGMQRLLEAAGIHYAGCDSASSALTMDKTATKLTVAAAAVPVIPGITLSIADCGFRIADFQTIPSTPSAPSQISNLKSPIPPSAPSEISNLKSEIPNPSPIPHSEPPSQISNLKSEIPNLKSPLPSASDNPQSDNPQSAIRIPQSLGPDLILKPNAEGSSVGLHIISTPAELDTALADARARGGDWLLERRIRGRELAVGVLNGRAMGIVEIRPKSATGAYDYASKYTAGLTDYLAPAPLDEPTAARIRALAETAFAACRCRDFARVDFMFAADEESCNSRAIPTNTATPTENRKLKTENSTTNPAAADRILLLEINTLPGMTALSLLPKSAACIGLDFPSLLREMLAPAIRRWRAKSEINS